MAAVLASRAEAATAEKGHKRETRMPKRTPYIAGAGASQEAGLPTGEELKKSIIAVLGTGRHDRPISDMFVCHALEHHARERNQDIHLYVRAANRIQEAMPLAISIDNLLDAHRDDKEIELCGKLAIVRSILRAENESHLKELNFHVVEKTWYTSFMKLLTENCTKEDLSKRLESVALIIFNYDRCIEHFLHSAFQAYYGLESHEADKLVSGMRIYHPYGVVGPLPWQNAKSSVAFGENELGRYDLFEGVHQIKTFAEGTDPQSSEIVAIRNEFTGAARVVFLGFAYHEINMDLLMSDNPMAGSSNIRCFGTAYEISRDDCERIAGTLKGFFRTAKANVCIRDDVKCAGLFHEYWKSLSLA